MGMENDTVSNIPQNHDAANSNSTAMPFAMPPPKPFPDTSKIDALDEKNFRR